MSSYLLIASEDPYESRSAERFFALAQSLAKGNDVSVFLVQNGVLPARAGAKGGWIASLKNAGVTVLADDFSLKERGIQKERLEEGVTPASIDVVLDHLVAGAKVLWH